MRAWSNQGGMIATWKHRSRIGRRLRACSFLVCMPLALASGQVADTGQRVNIAGDTTGLPPSCTTSAAIAAVKSWFRAVETGDPRFIAHGVSRHFRWISVSPFTRSERLFDGRRWSELQEYVERRHRQYEVLRLRSIQFNGWRDGALQFGPILYERSADDLGPTSLSGMGKGAYACGEGLIVLSIAPA